MKTFGALLVCLFLLFACVPAQRPLTFAVIPADDPAMTREYWDPIVAYLSAGVGREIELYIVPDYAAQVEALRAGHVDFARLGSTAYIAAVKDGVQIEPIVAAIKGITGVPGYYGYIVARADSDIESLGDLQGRSFAYVDPLSSSGYLIPAYALQVAGIEVGEVFMSGSHEASVLAVWNGTVEAAAVAQIRYDSALEENGVPEGALRVVWQSDLIPNVPIVVQQGMDTELKALLRRLFLDMPAALVEGPSRAGEVGYAEIADSDYDILRAIEAYVNQ